MISREIKEPILITSKPSQLRRYYVWVWPALCFGMVIYMFLNEERGFDVGQFFLYGALLVGLNFFSHYKDEVYVTGEAIYKRLGIRKYRVLNFSDLTYAYFENKDSIFLIFGKEELSDFMLMEHANNYIEIRAFLENISKKQLPHHRYEYAQRGALSDSDKLGCLECKRNFSYSSIKQWTEEKTGWIFKKMKPQSPVCPYCRTEDKVIVSRTGYITPQGLTALNALRSSGMNPELNR